MSFDRIFLWEKSMIIVNFIVDHFYRSEKEGSVEKKLIEYISSRLF